MSRRPRQPRGDELFRISDPEPGTMSRTTVVCCSAPGCELAAEFKVAAPWSDQHFWELKTYGFACREHLRDVQGMAEARWLDYEPVPGEVVGYVGIYQYEAGRKDRELSRVELDEQSDDDRW